MFPQNDPIITNIAYMEHMIAAILETDIPTDGGKLTMVYHPDGTLQLQVGEEPSLSTYLSIYLPIYLSIYNIYIYITPINPKL